MRRPRHRADRDDRRHRRHRDDRGNRHRRLRGEHRRRRHRRRRGSYRHRHRRDDRHRPGRPDDRRVHRDADHPDVVDDRLRPVGGACCLVRRHLAAEHRDAGHRGAGPGDAASRAARRAAPRRTGCCRHVACEPRASVLPGEDPVSGRRASGRDESGLVPDSRTRPSAARQRVPTARAVRAAPEPGWAPVRRAWGRRAWPPGSPTWRRAWGPPRRCRMTSRGRACRHRMTRAVDERRALPPSTTRI
jgi:hypothetical protein